MDLRPRVVSAREAPVLTKDGYPQDLLARELELILWQFGELSPTAKMPWTKAVSDNVTRYPC